LQGAARQDSAVRLLAALLIASLASRADARDATGYRGGQKIRVKVVEVAGAELEARTARAFKTMARAEAVRWGPIIKTAGVKLD